MKSLNRNFKEQDLEKHFEELEEREEFVCAAQACGANAEPCLGAACLLACIGIGPCLLGLHTVDF